MTVPTVPAPAPGDLRDALAGGIADVLLDGGSFSPRAFADRLLAGPLKPYLAAEATIADLTAERDAALESARGLYDDRTRECETASRYWNEARRLDANLLDLARMYGEACADLVRLHMALDYDDIAWGMYTARRDRERIEALMAERDAARTGAHQHAQVVDRCQQAAGKALGYPWFKDDQRNFPGATEKDGVCIGEHCEETIVEELARVYAAAEAQTQALQARIEGLEADRAAALDKAMKRGIRRWSDRLHIPVTRMMSRVLREEISAALDAQPTEQEASDA